MEVTHDSGAEQAAPEQQDAGGAGGFDLGPLTEQVSKLSEGIDSRLSEFEQRLPQQEDQYARNDLGQFAGQQDPYAQNPYQPQQPQAPGVPGQPQLDEYGELTPEAAQAQLQQMLNPMLTPLQQQQQQLMQTVQQQQEFMQELQLDRGAEQLETEFPELKNPEAAKSLVDYVVNELGRPDLVGDVRTMRMAYRAQRADAAAANETAATPGPSLEPAGGASLAGAEDNPQQRIKAAGGRNSIWGI